MPPQRIVTIFFTCLILLSLLSVLSWSPRSSNSRNKMTNNKQKVDDWVLFRNKKPGRNPASNSSDGKSSMLLSSSSTNKQPFSSSSSSKTKQKTVSLNNCTVNNPYFELKPPVMPTSFLEDLINKTISIGKRYKRQWKAAYDKENIDDCQQELPECNFFLCLSSSSSVGDSVDSSGAEGDARTAAAARKSKPAVPIKLAQSAYRKCCVEHRRLKLTMFAAIDHFEQHNITYFLSTGTALGALRHHGVIIPWDTDVDLVIPPSEKEKVRAIFSQDKTHHFHDDKLGKGMFWYHYSKNGVPRQGPHVEIFFEDHYTAPIAFPTQPCTMYHRSVQCPSQAMILFWFKANWRYYAGKHFHNPHRCTDYVGGKRIERNDCG